MLESTVISPSIPFNSFSNIHSQYSSSTLTSSNFSSELGQFSIPYSGIGSTLNANEESTHVLTQNFGQSNSSGESNSLGDFANFILSNDLSVSSLNTLNNPVTTNLPIENLDKDIVTINPVNDSLDFDSNLPNLRYQDTIVNYGITEILTDGAGNTLSTAYDIGNLEGSRTLSDYVGSGDSSDFYRFDLNSTRIGDIFLGNYGTTNLTISLTNLSADADVRVIRDVNSNGIVDVGDVITRSTQAGNTSESINLQGLGVGTYFVKVYQYSGDTRYKLSLNATAGFGLAPEPNNTLNQAYDIGTLNGNRNFSGWVIGQPDSGFFSNLNTDDYYRFNFDTTSDLRLSLNSLSADADVQVIQDSNYNGVVESNEVIASSTSGGTYSEAISLQGLAAGTYYIRVYAYGNATTSYNLFLNESFTNFSFIDASGDTNNVVATLGNWNTTNLEDSSSESNLVNLAAFPNLASGDYQLRAVARNTSGQELFSAPQTIQILPWNQTNGTFAGETLNYATGLGTGAVFLGRGGTDTLNLSGVSRSNITGINGMSLNAFNPLSNSTTTQAIFKGTAFDFLTLTDGREIYFQGIENLEFSDGSRMELQVRPNDTLFGQQWNLHISDVDSAWRFTQGSVLLASLDMGILTAVGASGGITDIEMSRLVTDPSDDDNYRNYGHGHSAISVMASTANNNSGVAGINWNSKVFVNDVYNGVSLQQAIRNTIDYARANGQRVVFQGGIQGENWLTSGGTQAELEQLIRDNADIAFFAVAAGNGYRDVDDTSLKQQDVDYCTSIGLRPSVPVFSGGVARLQTNHNNVMSVGALSATWQTTVNGLTNATSVDRASYSNFGPSLTLMAATNSPAMDKFGNMQIFDGTSCANPNMAGIASLVWSVNSHLNGGQLRQVLIDTAMDLGTAGRDDTFGHGLVNADAAVRRAWALNRNSEVANLYAGGSLLV